jgi:hypothetical protein
VYAIYAYPASSLNQNVNVNNNVIGGISCSSTSTGGFGFNGVWIGSTIGGSTSTVSNNLIGSTSVANSITLPSTSGAASLFRGIYAASSTGAFALTVDNNTIANVRNNSTFATSGGAFMFGFYWRKWYPLRDKQQYFQPDERKQQPKFHQHLDVYSRRKRGIVDVSFRVERSHYQW